MNFSSRFNEILITKSELIMGEMWNKGTTEELGHPVKALKVTDGNGFLGFERVSLNQTKLGQKKISILFHAWIIRISVPTSFIRTCNLGVVFTKVIT